MRLKMYVIKNNKQIIADFVFEHDILTNEELKKHRRKILEYIQQRKMVLNK